MQSTSIGMRFWTVAIAAIVIALTADGCGSSPTSPSGASPQVTSISPAQLVREDAPQAITISGRNFISGLTVELTDPMGGSRTIERDDIQALQSTSFQMIATFSLTGAYSIRIRNPSGDQSGPFTFSVQSQGRANPPHIPSIIPTSPVPNTN